MLIKQIIKLELRGLGPSGRKCTPKLLIFIIKQIQSLKEDLRWIIIYC